MDRTCLEHVNVTVSEPRRFADMLTEIFGWEIRWSGSAIHDGEACHVGGENSYFAVYSRGGKDEAGDSYATRER